MTGKGPRGERATLRLLSIGCFTSSFDRFMIAPLLILIADDLDRSVSAVTLAATFYFLAYGIMQAVWAILSDRLGRVRTMRLALTLAAVTGVLSAAAPTLEVLLVSRTLAGAAFAAAVPGALVYIGDTIPAERRHAPMTDLMTGAAVGMAVSTAGAAVVGEYLHWRLALALTAVVAGVLTVLMRRVAEPIASGQPSVRRSFVRVLTDRWALLVLALAFIEGIVLLGLLTFIPVTLQSHGVSTTMAGVVTTVFGISTMVFAGVVKRLTVRVSAWRLIGIGAVCALAAYACLMLDQEVPGVFAGCVLLGAARAFMHSTLQTWVTDVVPDARATAVSLFATLLFTGSAVATAVGGGLVADGRFVLLYGLALGTVLPLGLVASWGRRRYAVR
jgi:predicted MFS family arabinose efflux permease